MPLPAHGRGLLLLSLTFLLVPASRVEGQGLARGRVVIVRVLPGEAERGASVEEALLLQLRARGLAASPPAPVPPPRDLEDLDALRRAGAAFTSLHPEEARSLLEQVLARAAERGGLNLGHEGLLEAHLLAARVALALGDRPAFESNVDVLAAIAPDLELSRVDFPPAFIEAVDARREAAGASERATVDWSEAPEDLEVHLDGALLNEVGRSVEVPAGTHYLALRRPGVIERGERLSLGAGARFVPGAGTPDPEAAFALARDLRRPRREVLAASRDKHRCVLLVELRRAAERVEVWAADPCASRRATIEQPADALPEAIAEAIVEAILVSPLAAVPDAGEAPPPRRRRIRRGVGIAIAVACVAAAAGAAVAVRRSNETKGFTLQWSRKGGH